MFRDTVHPLVCALTDHALTGLRTWVVAREPDVARHCAGKLDEAEFTAAIASLDLPFTLKPVSELAPSRSFYVHGHAFVRVRARGV